MNGQQRVLDQKQLCSFAFGVDSMDFNISMNENNELQFQKVFGSLMGPKDELFSRVISYFSDNYRDENNILQQQDKENGIVTARGVFLNISQSVNEPNKSKMKPSALTIRFYDAIHSVRVDIRDERIRYTLTISGLNIASLGQKDLVSPNVKYLMNQRAFTPITAIPPFLYVPKDESKGKLYNQMIEFYTVSDEKAFKALCLKSQSVIKEFEKRIKSGVNQSKEDNW